MKAKEEEKGKKSCLFEVAGALWEPPTFQMVPDMRLLITKTMCSKETVSFSVRLHHVPNPNPTPKAFTLCMRLGCCNSLHNGT